MALTLSPLPDIPLIHAGDDLVKIIARSSFWKDAACQEGDVFIIAQKVISKSEGRQINLTQVIPSQKAIDLANECQKDPRFVELVLQESSEVVRVAPGRLIVEHKKGFICANAGIDHSNVDGEWGKPDEWVLLLPLDPDKSAEKLRFSLQKTFGISSLGVLIIDSHGRAWRNGIVGTTIGLSGLPGLVDMRGEKDLFGFTLKITQIAAADELACAASLVMGQASEGTPIVHAHGFPYRLRDSTLKELIRPKEQDLFR